MPYNTVADHLHDHRAAVLPLSWSLRLNVVIEAVATVAYLHPIEPFMVYSDEKTTNILLDAESHVKVADFGLTRLFPLDGATGHTKVSGPGYSCVNMRFE